MCVCARALYAVRCVFGPYGERASGDLNVVVHVRHLCVDTCVWTCIASSYVRMCTCAYVCECVQGSNACVCV